MPLPCPLLQASLVKECTAEEALTPVKANTPVALKSRPNNVCFNSSWNRSPEESSSTGASPREQWLGGNYILKTGEEASLSVLPQSLQINPQKCNYCHGGKTEDSEDVEEC